MPTNQNDVIKGPYRAAVDALAGDDLLYWTHTSGNATLRGGSTGEHYDTNPYNAGNPGGDRLYLPVENIELLTRYGHEQGLLDKLGGGAWQARKSRLKDRIRQIADKLMRIAAERVLRAAPVLEPERHEWEAFAARFPYTETDDQMAAIEDVSEDLSAGRPMDRLVVGDVGFGKTEVALRAAAIDTVQLVLLPEHAPDQPVKE